MQNMWGKGYVQMKKKHFFQWHSGKNIKIATSAQFESPNPSATWNSKLCYFFPEIFGDPAQH